MDGTEQMFQVGPFSTPYEFMLTLPISLEILGTIHNPQKEKADMDKIHEEI
jgi:hypothetical protein